MGLIHIYCGDGKGKTTASLGLALRASGSGMRVHIVQFMKGSFTSELNSLQLIPNITVDRCNKNYGFTFNMSDKDKIEISECHNKMLLKAEKLMKDCYVDMLILDEFNVAYGYGLFDLEVADRIVFDKPENIELVITGRKPQQKFIDTADYVSEIKAVKHPIKKEIKARKGIEF